MAGAYSGDWGSRKYLLASCRTQSLKRMGVDYFDIFLPPPSRSGDAAGGDYGGTLASLVQQGQGPLRGRQLLSR